MIANQGARGKDPRSRSKSLEINSLDWQAGQNLNPQSLFEKAKRSRKLPEQALFTIPSGSIPIGAHRFLHRLRQAPRSLGCKGEGLE